MKIGFAWKWWAWKTTLSSLVIQKLSKSKDVLALDLDSNVNLALALWVWDEIKNLKYFWKEKHTIMKYTWSTEMTNWEERTYLPKETDGFYTYESDFINEHSIRKGNIKIMSLWFIDDELRWIESMCDYYEMSKVFLNHINLDNNQILVADLAAWIEMISRATVMSFDLIFVVTDANFKNIKVSKDILKDLALIWFEKDEIAIIPNKYLDLEDLNFIKKEFDWYNILEGIEFDENIYKLDSDKKLESSLLGELDKKIDKIAEMILNFKQKSKEEIYDRIDKLDKKKQDFLK